jgi:hypothetical protein
MEELQGLILYTWEMDGCLNGVYTNNRSEGVIFNEIARKIERTNPEILDGNYHSSYFENNGQATLATLNIETIEGTIHFIWQVDGRRVFEGFGYLMNPRQISVYYWQVIQ